MSNDFDQDILLCVCTVYIYLVGVIKNPLKGVKKELILGNLSMVWQQWAVDLFHIAEEKRSFPFKNRLTYSTRTLPGIFNIFSSDQYQDN